MANKKKLEIRRQGVEAQNTWRKENSDAKLDVLKLPEQERAEYERYQDNLHYRASMVHSSYYLGKKEGKGEGRAEGEQQKAVEIANNLIDVLDDETIAEKTGLSVEKIARIREEQLR